MAGALELIEVIEAEHEALNLRLRGFSYAAIAEIQECHAHTARARVSRAIKRQIPKETIDEARRLEVERIDALIRLNLAVIESSATLLVEKMRAQDTLLRCMERKSKFLGLDAPVVIEQRHSDTTDSEIEALVIQLSAVPDMDAEPADG